LVAAVSFFVLDMLWLTKIAKRFYMANLGKMLLEKPRKGTAAGFYLLYVAGVVFFAIVPAVSQDSMAVAFGYGSLLGLMAYSTYDMTNYATLRNWPIIISVVDVCWGTLLTGMTAMAGFLGVKLIV
jgi:uncharacterized membrane protein